MSLSPKIKEMMRQVEEAMKSDSTFQEAYQEAEKQRKKLVSTITCPCGKDRTIVMADIKTSPLTRYVEDMCSSCGSKVFGDYCTFVCIKCKTVAFRARPYTTPSGFVFKKGEVYHVTSCPKCVLKSHTAEIIEQKRYEDAKGWTTKHFNPNTKL